MSHGGWRLWLKGHTARCMPLKIQYCWKYGGLSHHVLVRHGGRRPHVRVRHGGLPLGAFPPKGVARFLPRRGPSCPRNTKAKSPLPVGRRLTLVLSRSAAYLLSGVSTADWSLSVAAEEVIGLHAPVNALRAPHAVAINGTNRVFAPIVHAVVGWHAWNCRTFVNSEVSIAVWLPWTRPALVFPHRIGEIAAC